MTDLLGWFKKKRMVIRAWHEGTLVLMSYENPVNLKQSPIRDIVGIDRIEVTYE